MPPTPAQKEELSGFIRLESLYFKKAAKERSLQKCCLSAGFGSISSAQSCNLAVVSLEQDVRSVPNVFGLFSKRGFTGFAGVSFCGRTHILLQSHASIIQARSHKVSN